MIFFTTDMMVIQMPTTMVIDPMSNAMVRGVNANFTPTLPQSEWWAG